MKKILITGCSGYIGSHLCKMLSGRYEIHGLDIVPPKISIQKFHNLDIKHLPTVAQKYHAVIHLAALVNVGESERAPIDYYETNVMGTLNVIRNISTDNFIFASTGAAEGMASNYGISKRAAENCIQEFFKNKIDYTIFRFYNVIGSDGISPTNPDGLFFNLIKATKTGKFTIFGQNYNTPDGTCIRDYVHVNEICTALATAIESPSNSIENLGHGIGHSVLLMTELFQVVNNVNFDVSYGPRRPGDLEVSVLNNPSSYMKKQYSLSDLLKIDNK